MIFLWDGILLIFDPNHFQRILFSVQFINLLIHSMNSDTILHQEAPESGMPSSGAPLHIQSAFPTLFVAMTSMPVPQTLVSTTLPICTGALSFTSASACIHCAISRFGMGALVLTDSGDAPP